MTLNGRNVTLAEIDKNSGAHQKNFNEDRPAKCRPVIVVPETYKVYADMYRLKAPK